MAQGGLVGKELLGGAGLIYSSMEGQGASGELFGEVEEKMELHEKHGNYVEKLLEELET